MSNLFLKQNISIIIITCTVELVKVTEQVKKLMSSIDEKEYSTKEIMEL